VDKIYVAFTCSKAIGESAIAGVASQSFRLSGVHNAGMPTWNLWKKGATASGLTLLCRARGARCGGFFGDGSAAPY
jgi:hypothetical protein